MIINEHQIEVYPLLSRCSMIFINCGNQGWLKSRGVYHIENKAHIQEWRPWFFGGVNKEQKIYRLVLEGFAMEAIEIPGAFPLNMVMFHTYVSLSEVERLNKKDQTWWRCWAFNMIQAHGAPHVPSNIISEHGIFRSGIWWCNHGSSFNGLERKFFTDDLFWTRKNIHRQEH